MSGPSSNVRREAAVPVQVQPSSSNMGLVEGERQPAQSRAPHGAPPTRSFHFSSRIGIDFAAGTKLAFAWCHSGMSGLHSG